MSNPVRNGKGHYRRSLATAELEKTVLELIDNGWKPSRVAEHLGLADIRSVTRIHDRALDRFIEPAAEHVRAKLLAQNAADYDIAQQKVENPSPKTTPAGKLVYTENGELVLDDMVVMHALDLKRKLRDQASKLLGADRPAPVSVDQARSEMNEYLAEIQAKAKLSNAMNQAQARLAAEVAEAKRLGIVPDAEIVDLLSIESAANDGNRPAWDERGDDE